MKSLTCMLVVIVATTKLCAQEVVPAHIIPCTSPEATQFDFWLGKWNLQWQAPNGGTATGTNTVKKILGGCVIEENFDGGQAMPLKGISHSVYNVQAKQWRQTWVDNQGSYLEFSGGMKDGKMILSRTFDNPSGGKIMQRMVFYDIAKDALTWSWERSDDEGKNWKVNWVIHYTRKK